MTPTEYREACAALGITIAQSGKVLGMSLRTVRGYASGERPIPESVARLMQAMIRERRDAEEVGSHGL